MINVIRSLFTVPVMMLLIAIATLVYSGYRAELNQANQTARSAGFEVLKSLNTLQMIADAHRYTPEAAPSYLNGWTQILLIDDLSDFIAADVEQKAENLHTAWQENLDKLESDEANAEITSAIKSTRTTLKEAIQSLH